MVMKKTRMLQKCLVPLGILMVSVLIFSVSASAQSGRRIRTPAVTPTPVPETTPTPKPAPEPDPIDAKYSFKVVRSVQSFYNRLIVPENIHSRVVERLAGSTLVRVERGGESNRKEAINLAESLAETYVVLLTISEEEYSNPTRDPVTGKTSNGRLRVNFDIFAPQTGKSAGSGSTYVDFNRSSGILGRTRQNRCYPNVYGEELALLEAGYEIAERIMKKFELPVSRSCR
jgi:hypothetical protein